MTAGWVRAYIGLGSNLDDPAAQLRKTLEELASLPDTELVAASSLYRSDPLGPPGQPDYVNAVAALDTGLDAEALLDELQAIEAGHGRVRAEHWGPRTLDLDILLYGQRRIASDRLSVPHVQLPRRAFVLYPLAEIAPELVVPGLGPLSELLRACPKSGISLLDD